jgi:hypothetical protein
MYGDSASIEVTATMPVDSTSAADLLQAALGGTVYKSALIAAHNLAANSTFELARPSITAHLLQVGASGDLVQVVITGAFQVSSPPTTGNLIVNGDFSKPYAGGSGSSETFYPRKTTYQSAAQEVPGWTVGGDSVDLTGHGFFAMPASWPRSWQAVDLSGNGPGSITQTVGTLPGSSYLLKWYATGNPGCGQSPKVMHVSWDGKLIASPAISTSGLNSSSVVWSPESQVVTASSAPSVLVFADASSDKSPCGAVVADVSLKAAPR